MGTKNDPGKFDCYANAAPDEPMFILLGRDPAAAMALVFWCELRVELGLNGANDSQIKDAQDCYKKMVEEAQKRGKNVGAALVAFQRMAPGHT